MPFAVSNHHAIEPVFGADVPVSAKTWSAPGEFGLNFSSSVPSCDNRERLEEI